MLLAAGSAPAAATDGGLVSGPSIEQLSARVIPSLTDAADLPRATSSVSPMLPASGAVVSTAGFAGIGHCDYECLEPPDPWVAVNATHVVQAVNRQIRISTRAGAALLNVSLADFFGEPIGQLSGGDPRVIWDELHGRWLGTQMSVDCAAGHIYLAVSDGADPTGGWVTYHLDTPGVFADFPGLGLSSDKIALSANLFDLVPVTGGCEPGDFVQSQLSAMDWSAIGNPSIAVSSWVAFDIATWRPAVALDPTNAIPVVMELAGLQPTDRDVGYTSITGTIAGGTIALGPIQDLTQDLSLPGFVQPPIPAGFIETTIDGRPTDALWLGNRLWFVSTGRCLPGGDTQDRACVRFTALNTATATPSVAQDFWIGEAGRHYFMGGLGFARDGALFTVFSGVPAASAYPISTIASVQRPGDPVNSYRTPSIILAGAPIGYLGTRWGDYVGMARDPLDSHAVWQGDEYVNSDGTWATWISALYVTFIDLGNTAFFGDILWLAEAGITSGCGGNRFCPNDPVARGQMAAFLARALNLPNATADYFTDDEASIFEADINRLAEAGITTGCTPTTFCPDGLVTRGQMAAFLERALALPATAIDFFTDDETSIFEPSINRLAAAGITTGCTPTTFCPDGLVTRGQMAAFLHRALA